MARNWWMDSDNQVSITGLVDRLDDSYINDATVSCQMNDEAGTAAGDPFTLDYIGSSDGVYKGSYPNTDADDLTEHARYILTITIADTGSNVLIVKVRYIARYKEPDD